jgi:hypothetical protein
MTDTFDAYESINPSSQPQIAETSEDKGRIAGIVDSIHYKTQRAMQMAMPGLAPAQKAIDSAKDKVMEVPGVRNRVEGAKGLIGAASVSVLNPIASAMESSKALKQMIDGKERVVKPPHAILMSTPTGLIKTAKGAAKLLKPETREEGAKEMASGVRETVFGDDGSGQMAA